MVWNQKIAFSIFLVVLIIICAFTSYFLFFDSSEDPLAERFFGSIGLDSGENSESNPAVPLPSGSSGSGSSTSSGGSSGGSGSSTGSSGTVLRFCTFDAYHTVTGSVPCRCGFSAVCYSLGSVCDATFNNGEGFCS